MSRKTTTTILKNYIYNDFLQGATFHNIVSKLQNDDYNIGQKYTWQSSVNLIKEVKQLIKEDFQKEQEGLREGMLAKLYDLYEQCVTMGDKGTALKTLQEVSKLCGIYPKEQKQIDMNLNGTVEIDFGIE